jgi:prepilin-type N-terminal cleavage/methylation domain-containing protein
MKTMLHAKTDESDKGFTLIEVLISLAILSIGILAVASLQVSASLQTRNSLEITEACAIASYQMEVLMEMPFADVATTSSYSIPTGYFSIPTDQYNIQWMVTPADLNGDGTTEAKSIHLTVTPVSSPKRKVDLIFMKHNDLAV